jgi:hypothetical protein
MRHPNHIAERQHESESVHDYMYRTYGYITDSIVLVTVFQAFYILDALYMEPAIMTTMDVPRTTAIPLKPSS